MKKLISVILLIALLMFEIKCNANTEPVLIPMELTYYLSTGNPTASGCEVREGIVACKPEWLGKTVIIYIDDNGLPGDLVGIYEVLDTGYGRYDSESDTGTILAGKTIDVFVFDANKGKELCKLTNARVLVQIIDAEG